MLGPIRDAARAKIPGCGLAGRYATQRSEMSAFRAGRWNGEKVLG